MNCSNKVLFKGDRTVAVNFLLVFYYNSNTWKYWVVIDSLCIIPRAVCLILYTFTTFDTRPKFYSCCLYALNSLSQPKFDFHIQL